MKKRIKLVLLIFAVTSSATMALGELRVADSTTRKDLFTVTRNGESGPGEAREIHLTARYPSGKEAAHELLVLFDPGTHYYIWAFTSAWSRPDNPDPLEYSASRSAIAVGNGRMAWFGMGQPNLYVRDSSQLAADLDDASQRSLREASLQLPVLEHNAARQEFEVEIGKELSKIQRASGGSFFAPPNREVEPGPFPLHVRATYIGENWEVIVEARLKAKIILSRVYAVLKVEQVK